MTKLKVRCCCNPEIVYGYLNIQNFDPKIRRYRVMVKQLGSVGYISGPRNVIRARTIEVQGYIDDHEQGYAVKSMDRGVEWFKQLYGFEELV